MKHWTCRAAIAFLLLGSVAGCSGGKSEKSPTAPAREERLGSDWVDAEEKPKTPDDFNKKVVAAQKRNAPGEALREKIERKVIYTATLKVIVEHFDKAEDALLQLVEDHNGVLEMTEVTIRTGSPRSGKWRVRIPPERLTAFRKAIARLGEAEQNNLDSKEVTEEFYDVVEQMKSKEKELETYRRLYEKAKEIPEVILVKKELDRVEDELNRLKGRHRVLKDLTDLTTVNITMRERGAYVPEDSPDFGNNIGKTFSGSLSALATFGRGVTYFLVALAPWLPLVLLVIVPVTIKIRRWRAEARKAAEAIPILEVTGPTEDKD